MKVSELRDKAVEELRSNESDLKRELFNLRFQVVTGEIQNPMRIRAARREIARLKTIITEKVRQEATQKTTEASKEEGTR